MSIKVTRSSMPPFEEYCEEIKELWESRWLTNAGVKHNQLEEELEKYLNVPNVTLYTNGHLALENIIETLEFPKGSEVITTPFTFASTTNAIARSGLVPVFCDINRKDYTIDVSKIEALITEKTVAIVPVHVYGNICDIEEIERIAKKYSLKVIYDAAHAFGVTYKGISAASMGDASMFSFHATKVFNTVEGGAVCYADNELEPVLVQRRNFGLKGVEGHYIGANSKMSEFHAAMGLCNLRHIDGEIEKRKAVVAHYRKRIEDTKGIVLCEERPEIKYNYAYLPVVFDGFKLTRDEVYEKLKENGIITRKYFYPLTNDFDCYKQFPTAGKEKTPVADYISKRVLCLPLYADLAVEDIDRICDIILKN